MQGWHYICPDRQIVPWTGECLNEPAIVHTSVVQKSLATNMSIRGLLQPALIVHRNFVCRRLLPYCDGVTVSRLWQPQVAAQGVGFVLRAK
jgi:hypothetical protein